MHIRGYTNKSHSSEEGRAPGQASGLEPGVAGKQVVELLWGVGFLGKVLVVDHRAGRLGTDNQQRHGAPHGQAAGLVAFGVEGAQGAWRRARDGSARLDALATLKDFHGRRGMRLLGNGFAAAAVRLGRRQDLNLRHGRIRRPVDG